MPTNRLTWTASTPGDAPLEGYRVYDADTDELIIDIPNPATLTYDHENLDPGTYRYYVRPYATDDQVGAQSNVLELVIGTEQPGAVVLSGELVGDDAELEWTASIGGSWPIDEYQIYRATNGGAYSLLDTVSGGTLIYTDSTIVAPNLYQYYVVAVDTQSNESPDSNVVDIDSGFDDIVVLLQAHTGTLIEVSGLPDVSVTGAGAVSATDPVFGVGSFRNPGTFTISSNFVRMEDASDAQGLFVFPGEFTIEFWVRLVTYGNTFANLLANSINYPNAGFIQMAVFNFGTHRLFWNSSPGISFSASVDIPLDEWVFCALTRDAANLLTMWQGGVSVASATVSGTLGALNPTRSSLDFGRGLAGDNSDIDCYFDQLRMTKRCRYTAPFTPPTAPFPSNG